MTNPNFGKWLSEDDVDEIDIFGTAPSAEEEALERLKKDPRKNKTDQQETKKLIVEIKKLFAGPENFEEKDPYRRPFTCAEAKETLRNAGLGHAEILNTYLSGWAGGGYDPCGLSQVIVALVEGRELHLHMQRAEKGWHVARVLKAG